MNKISILQVESYYAQHLEDHYKKNLDHPSKTYDQLWQSLMYESNGGIGDAWKETFESYGHFAYEIVVIDDPILQKKWAAENHIKYTEANWRIEIFWKQIEVFRPEVIFFHHMDSVDFGIRKKIKTEHRFVKYLMTWDGIGICNAHRIAGYDVVLSCMKYVRDFYTQIGLKAFYTPLAFDGRVPERITPTENKTEKITFVGGIALFNKGHFERLHLLTELAKTVPVDFYLLGIHGLKRILISEIRCLLKGDLKGMRGLMYLNSIAKDPVFGIDMYQKLHDSLVTLNIHIDAAKNEAANMRLFEATGVGTCLLTDWKPNLHEFFTPDQEVMAYKNFEECVEKAQYLLQNPHTAQEIAKNGQKKTLTEHTYNHRLKELADFFRQNRYSHEVS